MLFQNWRSAAGICLLALGAACASANPGGGTSTPPQGTLARDQFPWRFTRTAMAGAARSIIVPLSTNLHLAFDVQCLRSHVAWAGSRPLLPGYQFGQGPGSFATFAGTTLWTTPPVFPWRFGSRAGVDSARPSGESDFRGISTKGASVMLVYDLDDGDGRSVRVHESARAGGWSGEPATNVVVRRFEMASLRKRTWFLAHEEAGSTGSLASGARLASVRRSNDVLVVMVRGNRAELEVETVATNAVRVWVRLEPHRRPDPFEILTVVSTNEGAASTLMREIGTGTLAQAEMNPPGRRPNHGARLGIPPLYPGALLSGRAGGDASYRREQIAVPKELELLVGGMDWLPDGVLAVSTWTGEVYLAGGLAGPGTNVTWRRFASGLHEPLGLKLVNGEIYVVQKCELTRLVDTDRNGEADWYECVNDDWGFNGNMHYFAYGPALDAQGNFHISLDGNTAEWSPQWDVPFRGWTVKISPDGRKLTGVSSGLRSPNGCFAFGPDRDIFTTDNEGHWLGTCKLNHCRPGKFFGYPSSMPRPREVFQKPPGQDPPAVWFPRKLATSASGGATIPEGFGPFAGQLLVGDFGTSSILRVALERVNGEWQGAVWPFAKGFLSGVNRLAFGPDGRLYVGQLRRGWASSGPQDFALERVVFTGETPFEVCEVRARRDGFLLKFTEPIDPAGAADPANWDASQFGYRFHATYGSPEIDHSGKENNATPLVVTEVNVSADRLEATIRFADWKAGYVTAVRSKTLRSAGGRLLWHDTFYYTLNQIPR